MKGKKIHRMFWLVLNYMYRFCECKYRFKLRLLWRKLELKLNAKVHKKMHLLLIIKPETYLWSHHNRIALCALHRTLFTDFFPKKNIFFLIPSWKSIFLKKREVQNKSASMVEQNTNVFIALLPFLWKRRKIQLIKNYVNNLKFLLM